MPQPHTPPPLSYLRLRWRWSAQALREGFWRRRLQAGALAACWPAAPVTCPVPGPACRARWCSASGPWPAGAASATWAPGGLLLQTALGALQALAFFPWLWSPAWRTQDHALPIPPPPLAGELR
jgi:hypothetical protein